MSALTELPKEPTQLLKPEAYTSDEWLQREYKELFEKTWHFACTLDDLEKPGDFITKKVGTTSLFIIRDGEGELRAFHNICRHRGTELVEGSGNAGKTLVCPYHRWTFNLDGRLRGLPDQKACFPDLNKKEQNLLPASVDQVGKLVFVNPDPEPVEDFKTWIADVPEVLWPHDVTSSELVEFKQEVVYKMNCNWKVFFENAIDGYHLAYLHENTLGGPDPDKNIWDTHGRHLVWYSTERDNGKHRIPKFVEDRSSRWLSPLKHVGSPGYGGVYMLFPTTTIAASPFSIAISSLEPIDANTTYLRVRAFGSKSFMRYSPSIKSLPGYDKKTDLIKSSHWTKHPLKTGDFQTEDVWVCEKMQRSLQSPFFTTTPVLAQGPGAEAPLTFFQSQVLDFVKPE